MDLNLEKQTINGLSITWSSDIAKGRAIHRKNSIYIHPDHKYDVAFRNEVTEETVDWCIEEAKYKILEFINLRCDQAIEEFTPIMRFRRQWMEMQSKVNNAWISSAVQLPINESIVNEYANDQKYSIRDMPMTRDYEVGTIFRKTSSGLKVVSSQIGSDDMVDSLFMSLQALKNFKHKQTNITIKKKIKIKLFFAWYDLWIGMFIDKPKSKIYVFPIPMFGIVISW